MHINKPMADAENNHGEEEYSFLNVNVEIIMQCSRCKQAYYLGGQRPSFKLIYHCK